MKRIMWITYFLLLGFIQLGWAEPYTISKEVQVFDLNDSKKVIGTFRKGTIIEIESESDFKGLVKISFQSKNQKIEGFVRAEDVGKEKPIVKDGVYEGSFTIPSRLFENAEIKVEYRIPVDAKGNPGPHADNIVFYAPWLPERKMMSKEYVKHFSDKLGFTVYSLNFTTQIENVEIRDKCYYYPESGSFDAVFTAQDRLIKDFNLKRNKLLILGISAGSTMAAQMAVHHPDKVEGVAIHGGWRYDLPKERSGVKWCILVSKGDFRVTHNEDFTRDMRNFGFNILYSDTPPIWKETGKNENWRHMANDLSLSILQIFLRDIASIRSSGSSDQQMDENWPWVASLKKQAWMVPNKAEELKKLPDGERIYFPSQELGRLWARIPRVETVLLDGSNDKIECALANPSQTPLGWVVFQRNWDPFTAEQMEDTLSYLVEKGYAALTIKGNGVGKDAPGRLQAALKWVVEQPGYRNVPIYLCGWDPWAEPVVQWSQASRIPALKGCLVMGSEYKPILNLSVMEGLGKKLPCRMILGVAPAKGSEPVTSTGFPKDPKASHFQVLEIPASTKNDEMRWQKMMEMLLEFMKASN